jgi:hypothetical protein
MTATTKVPLGAGVLARRWYLDVNTGTHGAPTWTGVFGIEDFRAPLEPSEQDDSDYDSAGYKSSVITALGWSIELKLARKATAALATAYDPGQEALRAASVLMGVSNRVEIRYYEMEVGGPRVEAYTGYASVSWSEDGGAMDAKATVTVRLTGQGARTAITHPDGAAVVPVLYSVDPAVGVQAGGTLHHLHGTGFYAAGVADVQSMKLGVTNVPTFHVLSDNELVFLAPAKAAGPFVIYVTNTVGESVTATVSLTIS